MSPVEKYVSSEGAPSAFDELGWSEAGALGGGVGENLADSLKALAGVVGEEVSAILYEAVDGVALEGGIVGPGEGVQVGEREAAPGGAQDGEGGDSVGGMKQSAGERGEVEDLLAVAEGFDLDGAEGN